MKKRSGTRIAPWKYLVGAWMGAVILAAFLYAGDAMNFVPGASRIIFFHVPMAIMATIAFWTSMTYALAYLYVYREPGERRPITGREWIFFSVLLLGTLLLSRWPIGRIPFVLAVILVIGRYQASREASWERLDLKSVCAAELGLLFCLLATITGSIFAKIMWNSFWNWDPRETSILVLLLLYGAYFGLRSSVEDEERRATLAAVYNLFAGIVMPFLIFVVPRIPALQSSHPEDIWKSGGMSADYRVVLYSSLLGFVGMFVWMFQLRLRTGLLEMRQDESPLAPPAEEKVK
jgi:ABC-type transport system involved in cytochrome c biogenesis permease subunit